MPDMNENAETQQEYFGVRTDNKRTLCNALRRIEELEAKLKHAEEIIKNLMVFAEMDDREYEKEYKEAEQFLNEVKK